VAPLAVRLVDLPAQIVGVVAVAETVGKEFTLTAIVVVFVHPDALVPVTVYVVDVLGEAVIELPEVPDRPSDGDQLYVDPPEAVKEVDLPLQIVELPAEAVTFGI